MKIEKIKHFSSALCVQDGQKALSRTKTLILGSMLHSLTLKRGRHGHSVWGPQGLRISGSVMAMVNSGWGQGGGFNTMRESQVEFKMRISLD